MALSPLGLFALVVVLLVPLAVALFALLTGMDYRRRSTAWNDAKNEELRLLRRELDAQDKARAAVAGDVKRLQRTLADNGLAAEGDCYPPGGLGPFMVDDYGMLQRHEYRAPVSISSAVHAILRHMGLRLVHEPSHLALVEDKRVELAPKAKR